MTPYYNSRTKTFNHEYTHKGTGGCAHCGISFAHLHPAGSTLKEFESYSEKPNSSTRQEVKMTHKPDCHFTKVGEAAVHGCNPLYCVCTCTNSERSAETPPTPDTTAAEGWEERFDLVYIGSSRNHIKDFIRQELSTAYSRGVAEGRRKGRRELDGVLSKLKADRDGDVGEWEAGHEAGFQQAIGKIRVILSTLTTNK